MSPTLGIPPETRRLRARIARIAERRGYVADGNHLFTAKDYAAIHRGAWRCSVIERPSIHRAAIVRLAYILARTY